MKLKFKNQDFQTNAVNAVVDLFAGQENTHSTFSVTNDLQISLNDFGVGNVLRIDRNTLAENMHTVQKHNLLPLTELEDGVPQFCIEMETGTGRNGNRYRQNIRLYQNYI